MDAEKPIWLTKRVDGLGTIVKQPRQELRLLPPNPSTISAGKAAVMNQTSATGTQSQLPHDGDQARRFIEMLTGSVDTKVTFQTFAESPTAKDNKENTRGPKLDHILHGTLAEHRAELKRLNELGAGIFITINETDLRGRSAENVKRLRAVWMDFDKADATPLETIKHLPLAAHTTVESSPGKFHAYFLLTGEKEHPHGTDEPGWEAMKAEFHDVQKGLAIRYGSDQSVNDLPRVMRLPGFSHVKSKPFLTHIVDTTGTMRYTAQEVKTALLPAPKAAVSAKPAAGVSSKKRKASHGVGACLEKIRSALVAIPAGEWDSRENWLKWGMCLHAHGSEYDTEVRNDCLALWCEFAQQSKKFNEADGILKWSSFAAKDGGLTIATLYHDAASHGWRWLSEKFTVEEDGVYFHGRDNSGEARPPLWICSRLEVTDDAADRNGQNWGKALTFEDPSGHVQTWVMPARLSAGDGSELRGELLDRGLRISCIKASRDALNAYLASATHLPIATYTDTPGWLGAAYVMPGGTFGSSDGGRRVLFQGSTSSDFSQKGTSEQWRENVAALATGNTRLMFSISAAFAPSLLAMTGADSGGFHFRGASSQGKTTIAHAAVSVWGDHRFMRNWRATSNGLEGVALSRNDNLLVLDELSQVDAREAGACAYMLANGRGKARAGKTGDARPTAQWRLLFLSTGETSLTTHMEQVGKRAEAGQEVRLVELQSDAGRGHGVYETLHGRRDGATLSEEIKRAAAEFHGAVGVSFLEQITRDRDTVARGVNDLCQKFLTYIADILKGAEGQALRVANRFALVAAAGTVATRYGLTGWAEGEPFKGARALFKDWLDGRGGVANTEDRATLQQVRAFFEINGASRFQPWDARSDDVRIHNRAGFLPDAATIAVYFVFPEVFKTEICKGRDPRTVTRLLTTKGWISPDGAGKSARVIKLPGAEGNKRMYAFMPPLLEAEID